MTTHPSTPEPVDYEAIWAQPVSRLFKPSSSPASSRHSSRSPSPVPNLQAPDTPPSNAEAPDVPVKSNVADNYEFDCVEFTVPQNWKGNLFGKPTSLLTGSNAPEHVPIPEPKPDQAPRSYCGFRSPRRLGPPSVPEDPLSPDHPLHLLPPPAARHETRASILLVQYWYLRRFYEEGYTCSRPLFTREVAEEKLCELRNQLTTDLLASEVRMKDELAAANITCESLITSRGSYQFTRWVLVHYSPRASIHGVV